VCKDCIAVSCN